MARSTVFSRKGPWILVTAVCLFLGVNGVLDVRYTAQREELETGRFVTERIAVAQLTRVSIAMPTEAYGSQIDIQYGDQADVTVGYDQPTMRVQQHAENKTLHIELAEVDKSYNRGREGVKIVLPTTLKTLVLQSKIQGRVSAGLSPLTDLSIHLDDCDSSAELGEMKVDVLRLSSACDQLGNRSYRPVGFEVNATHVKKLDVLMRRGLIDLKETARVSSLNLNVTDDVFINAPANLLRKARWGKVPERSSVN
jgi:hypothetical protein